MKRLYILTFCSIVLAACVFFFKKKNATTIATGEGLVVPRNWLFSKNKITTPTKDRRSADQTFLTYPEWFLVFSPEEQANYFKKHTSTSFPFMSHTAQIWESYKIVNDQIKDSYPVNTGYHFMIWVIGTSASVEYAVKAWYETVIGRITDTGETKTDEDKFNYQFTQAYVDFIKDRPWYEFNFKDRLKSLWFNIDFSGDHFLRKLERRYILTSELIVKFIYGKIIGLGTEQVYDEALPTTAVVIENDSLLYLPRYDKFADAVTHLAKSGKQFKEIAGNKSAILITILVPSNKQFQFENTKTIFEQPITSSNNLKRIALTVPVHSLNNLLIQLDKNRIKIEHVFDF